MDVATCSTKGLRYSLSLSARLNEVSVINPTNPLLRLIPTFESRLLSSAPILALAKSCSALSRLISSLPNEARILSSLVCNEASKSDLIFSRVPGHVWPKVAKAALYPSILRWISARSALPASPTLSPTHEP